MITLTPVQSSNLGSVGYDPATGVLAVTFKNNSQVHHYLNVPPEKHADLMAADSIGSYFAKHIRPVYDHQPVATADA